MDDDEIKNFEIKDVTSNLYRLVPEVKEEIINALQVYSRLPLNKRNFVISQALTELQHPVDVNAPPAPTVAPIAITHSDAVKEANFRNTITVIRKAISFELDRAEDENVREILTRLLSRVPDVL